MRINIMPPNMRRHHPLKWPVVITMALACLCAFVFIVPARWINQFFSPLELAETKILKNSEDWLIILPPPVVESTPEVLEPPDIKEPLKVIPPATDDPGWWVSAWQIKTENHSPSFLASSSRDSVELILDALGVGLDFTRKALPDSLLNHRLMLLRIEDDFNFDELKPYIAALGLARAKADKHSREAAMYDEHLGSTIMVPD